MMICGNCLTVGEPKQVRSKVTDGGASALFVLLLLAGLFFWPLLIAAAVVFVLGAFMSLASRMSRSTTAFVCRTCAASGMVPLETPAGRTLVERAQGAQKPEPRWERVV